MQLYKHYKGNRIRASDRSLVVRSLGGRLACLFLAVVLLLNINTLLHTDWNTVSLFHNGSIKLTVTPYMIVSLIAAVLVCALAALLYARYQPDRIKQLFHRQKLSRMILENGWYESEQSQDGGFLKTCLPTGQRRISPTFPKCTTAWRMDLFTYWQKSPWENIKTSSCTWKEAGNRLVL